MPKPESDLDPLPSPQLPGWPGYRTRPGRSGYDPIDTSREAAFMQGLLLRHLFTLQLRTQNPIYLSVMTAAGLGLLMPLVCSLAETYEMRVIGFDWGFTCWLPVALPGGFFLANVASNAWRRRSGPPEAAQGRNRPPPHGS